MKIAFCGDSFCRTDQPGSWPLLVAQHLDAEIVSTGISGVALYHSYESLITVVDEADYVIFCITEPSRLANKNAYPISVNSRWRKIEGEGYLPFKRALTLNFKQNFKRANLAADAYYKKLINFEYHDFVQKLIIQEIDKLMVQKQKKCIWFPCFDTSMQEYVPISGPLANVPLSTISYGEYDTTKMSKQEKFDTMRYDTRVCHLNEQNNKSLADLVISIIEHNNFEPGYLDISNISRDEK